LSLAAISVALSPHPKIPFLADKSWRGHQAFAARALNLGGVGNAGIFGACAIVADLTLALRTADSILPEHRARAHGGAPQAARGQGLRRARGLDEVTRRLIMVSLWLDDPEGMSGNFAPLFDPAAMCSAGHIMTQSVGHEKQTPHHRRDPMMWGSAIVPHRKAFKGGPCGIGRKLLHRLWWLSVHDDSQFGAALGRDLLFGKQFGLQRPAHAL
jgi:hypothetical protein